MSAIAERPTERRYTLGDVLRELATSGVKRSASSLRRLEEHGVIAPLRTPGLGLRLYSDEDIAKARAAFGGDVAA